GEFFADARQGGSGCRRRLRCGEQCGRSRLEPAAGDRLLLARLSIELIKGSGAPAPGERTLPSLARDTCTAALSARDCSWEPFSSSLAFAVPLIPGSCGPADVGSRVRTPAAPHPGLPRCHHRYMPRTRPRPDRLSGPRGEPSFWDKDGCFWDLLPDAKRWQRYLQPSRYPLRWATRSTLPTRGMWWEPAAHGRPPER
ncbi:MAG: hypothetical protein QOJ29_236, partial [Thermoleophilaceae bacterium]|nr:hypothetical protein [Thermoleophilaceae bacterium]